MYVPAVFECSDWVRIQELAAAYPFGTLIVVVDGVATADHLPVLLEPLGDGRFLIRGHIAAANPLVWALETGQPGLVVLQGPHGYVSPKAYQEFGVPTWNYVAVHCRGRLRSFRDPLQMKRLLDQLIRNFETGGYCLPDDARHDALLRHIVGFELVIETVQAKFKLSQNRSMVDRSEVIASLRSSGSEGQRELADWMDRIMAEG